jgi:hypothetical protein
MTLLAVPIASTFGSPFSDPGSLISALLPNIVMLAGVIFFLLLLYGAFKLIIESGKNHSAQAAQKAKDYITFALIGFLIVVSAYFILQIVSQIFFGSDALINSPVI